MVDKISAFFIRKQGRKKHKARKNILEQTGKIYLVLNKTKNVPFKGELETDVIVDNLIPKFENCEPIGYYNDMSEGLLVLSNDNEININNLEIEYVVRVDKNITPTLLKKLRQGVQVINTFSKPYYVEKIDQHHFRIVLNESMINQVTKMTEVFGYHVTRIMRVRVEDIVIDKIRKNKFRYLSIDEIQKLKRV